MARLRLTVAYDGAPFHGFAENVGVPTVAGCLREALERVLRHPVALTGAGRTDTGVHARGQVVSFDVASADVDLGRLRRSLNGLCGPAIVVRDAAVVSEDFDARFSASWRSYRYTVLNSPEGDPLLAHTAWHVSEPLSLPSMRLACDPFIGEHDFTSFCRRPEPGPGGVEPSMVRRVLAAEWVDVGDGVLRFDIRATAFCHHMVRSMVGTMVDVGRGRKHAGEIMGILRARHRGAAGTVAPPHGLCLWAVGYETM